MYGYRGMLKHARPDLLASRHRPRIKPLAAGCWLLAAGDWKLVPGGWHPAGTLLAPLRHPAVNWLAQLAMSGAILCDLGAILKPSWTILGHLGDLGPSWDGLGAILGPSSAILDHLGAILGHLRAIFGRLEPKTPQMTTVSRF